MPGPTRRLGALLSIGLAIAVSVVSQHVVAGGVPAGFEALLEKQSTLLDVYFANEFLVSAQAEYNTDEIEFLNPAEVAGYIPGVTDRDLIVRALTGPLSGNTQLRCYTRAQPNCGVLEPEVAGVIFEEDRFRVDIFVNSEYLVLQTIPKRAFLPGSDAGWSVLQNFSGAFSGNDDNAFDTMAFNAANMLAYRETRFLISTSYSNISDWTADDILVRRDFEGREQQLGYFRTLNDASLRFIPEVSLRGVRAASTLDTRTDLDTSSGRDLRIFLVNRSVVSLFKDGRLISSGNYDAGNQVINTSRLPAGAYPVTIKIEDASGRSREEQRFYVKSSRFPPEDQTLWGLELGEQVLRNSENFIPESEGVFFGRFTMSKRVTDNMALNGGVAMRDDNGILELGMDRLDPMYDLQLNAAVSDNSGYGFSIDARTRWRDVSLSGSYRESWADKGLRDDLDGSDPPDDDVTQALASVLDWFAEDSRQWSTTLTWYTGGGSLNLNARNTRLTAQQNTKEYSISYFYPLVNSGRYRVDLDMEASKFNDLKQFLVSVRFRWDQGNFTHTAATQYQHRDLPQSGSDDDLEFEVGTSWYDRSPEGSDLNINARASHRADFDDATASVRWRGRFGELDSQVRHERQSDNNRTVYTGGYTSSFAWTQAGVALGGAEQSRSAILIDLSGEDTGNTYFDVMINGTRRGTAAVGGRSLITVRPFATYQVDIIPRGEGFVTFEQRGDAVTLYPGNVATLSWDVSPVNVLFGRLLDRAGEPIQNAVIRGAAGLAMTDGNGYFQAEVKTSVRSLKAETRALECDFVVPDYEAVSGIALLGTLNCETRVKQP